MPFVPLRASRIPLKRPIGPYSEPILPTLETMKTFTLLYYTILYSTILHCIIFYHIIYNPDSTSSSEDRQTSAMAGALDVSEVGASRASSWGSYATYWGLVGNMGISYIGIIQE